ncbi:MAG: FxsA family protein, partial [Venatoribacter sp.]
MPLLFLFILLPILELVVFIQVGSKIGVLAVIALIILSALLGSAVMRAQGFITMAKARVRLAEGALPAKELAEGML